MKKELLLLLAILTVLIGVVFGRQAAQAILLEPDESLKTSRSFEFTYGATIMGVPENSVVRVWFPMAETNGQQRVTLTGSATPGPIEANRDEKYNNKIGFFQHKSNGQRDLNFRISYDVERSESVVDGAAKTLSDEEKKLFLSANTLVPLEGKPRELIEDADFPVDAMETGQALYQIVERHMKYDKTNPGYGKGDVVWACDSKTGNCTDFHSLFISLARIRSIPARFEIGFPIASDKTEGEVGGYHCWAWFHADGRGWAPVDISEADKNPELKDYYFGKLTADRVAFSTGRDIVLVPESKGEPLNYFVYPHVEVDGKPWPQDKIKLNFSFKNK